MDRHRGATVLGLVLCLLAAIFAIEAKVGWYSPAGSPPAQISSAKLQPADAPRQIAQALASPATPHFAPAEASLLLLGMAVLIAASVPFHGSVGDDLRIFLSPRLSPPLFRRPPPQY